jgi:hypothetical protein
VKATRAYQVKRALFDLLTGYTATNGPLAGIQVAYSYPPQPERLTIYGGGVRFTHEDMAGEVGQVVSEVVTTGLYLRAAAPDWTVRDADQEIETLADVVAGLLAGEPDLGGHFTWLGIGNGLGDYWPNDDQNTSTLGFQLQIGAVLT